MAKMSKAAQQILKQIQDAKNLTTTSGLQNIALDKIESIPSWNDEKLKAAMKQLKEKTAEPIQVSFDELSQKYKIGDGIHRVQAAKELGLKEISADVSKDTVHGLAKTTMAGAGIVNSKGDEDMKKDKKSLTERAKQVGSKAAELGGAALEKLSIPQQILMRRTAQAVGLEGAEDAEKSAEQITEKIASKLGIPESSEYAGPAAKAAIQTALEFGYDPVNLLGLGIVGKAAKGAQKSKVVQKVLGKFGKGEQALARLPTMAAREEAVLAGKMRGISAQQAADIKKTAEKITGPVSSPLPSAEEMEKALAEGRKAFAETQAAKKAMDPETRRYLKNWEDTDAAKRMKQFDEAQAARAAELSAEGRKRDAELAARMKSAVPDMEKTQIINPSDEAKQVAEEILKKRKK